MYIHGLGWAGSQSECSDREPQAAPDVLPILHRRGRTSSQYQRLRPLDYWQQIFTEQKLTKSTCTEVPASHQGFGCLR